MKNHIQLRDDDFCVVLTTDAEFVGFLARDDRAIEEADMIQEWMIDLMKHPENRKGVWLWRISKNHESVLGEQFITDE